MTTLELILGVAVLVLAAALCGVALLLSRAQSTDDEGIETEQLSAAMGQTIADLGLREAVAEVEQHAETMTETHESLESMLQHPQTRGSFGETQLETILNDHLPADMFGLQEPVVDGKQPDAYIDSREGIICIDSKFPLTNYRAALDTDDEAAKEEHVASFRDNVEEHLATVAAKYVRPAEGTERFAFVFVPSETVYHYLITEEQELLREYVAEGVQLVSPLTLGQKLELIQTGIHAQRMSEHAEAVQAQLDGLADRFDAVIDVWETFYNTHFQNATSRANEMDGKLRDLHREFESISELDTGEMDMPSDD